MCVINKKKGFTLIELLTVIAILGILVLLAAPKFLGYTEQAKLAQIKNDIKVHENHIDSELTRNEYYIENWNTISSDALNSLKVENNAYDKKGLLDNLYEFKENEYFEIPKKTVNTKLKGKFVHSEGGKVYYFDSKRNSEGDLPPWHNPNPDPVFDECSEAEAQGYICVFTVEDLINVNDDLNAKYILMNDIDLSSVNNWIPIGKTEDDNEYSDTFYGEFNGNNYAIKNINMFIEDNYDSYYIGLFGDTSDAVIENLTIDGMNFTAKVKEGYIHNGWESYPMIDDVGAITGYSVNTLFENISIKNFNMDVDNEKIWLQFAGSIVGESENDTFNNIYLENVNLKGTDFIAGLAGKTTTLKVKNVYGNVNIIGNSFVGGLVGTSGFSGEGFDGKMSVENVKLKIQVSATPDNPTGYVDSFLFGGLIGDVYIGQNNTGNLTIKNVDLEGDIYSNDIVGGLIGTVYNRSDKNNGEIGDLIGLFVENSNINVNIHKSPYKEEYMRLAGIIGVYGKDSSFNHKMRLIFEDVAYTGKINNLTENVEKVSPTIIYGNLGDFDNNEEHISNTVDDYMILELKNVSWDKTKNPNLITFDEFNLGR